MTSISEESLKSRMINRILKYSIAYEKEDLQELSLDKLKEIQKSALIPLILKSEFRNRSGRIQE